VRQLGHGAMGTVYEGYQKELERKVAVKVMRAGELASESDIIRFKNEATACAKLSHANIVAAYDVGEIDARSDVWSPGAILYELLTGRPPFTGENVLLVLQAVAFEDPVPPRQIDPNVPRDLEAICMKCLEKASGRRYRSAAEFADDLKRWLDGEAVVARPASIVYRMRKKVARHKAAFTTRPSILGRIRSGDELGWEEFVGHYKALVLLRARDRGLSSMESDDLLQDLILELFKGNSVVRFDAEHGTRFRDYL